MKLICAALVLLMTVPAFAAEKKWESSKGASFIGTAFPIDGDSLYVTDGLYGRIEVRLYGISAPEWDSPYGPFATRMLHEISYGKTVSCLDTGQTTHGRIVAICETDDADRIDLGATLIYGGAATPFRKYLYNADPELLTRYFGREKVACTLKWGLWRDRPDGICRQGE